MKKTIKVEGYEHACELLGLDPKHSDVFDSLPEDFRDPSKAFYELMIITKAANNSVPVNHVDYSYKYEPRFWVEATEEQPTGGRFVDARYGYWHSNSSVGSLLSSRNAETCLDLAKRFTEKYKALILEPIKSAK